MGQSDLELLLEMGFEKDRAQLAVKRTGGLQGALTWLEANQDKPLEDLQTDEDGESGPVIVANGTEEAKSYVCDDCGKKFRTQDQVQFHAGKTEHQSFSLSAEEVAPLTEEEKKARLQELREKMQEKRAKQSVEEKEAQKRNEQIRLKATKESQDIKEELARKEQIKEAAKKRQEKQDDLDAKRRIKAKIEADKAERKRKADEAKAAREGRPVSQATAATTPAAPISASKHSDARLRLQLASGNVMKAFPAETTLFQVAQQIEAENGISITSFTTTFPKKTWQTGVDFGQTLKEAGLVPSAVLIVK